jgi:hypothetical protein
MKLHANQLRMLVSLTAALGCLTVRGAEKPTDSPGPSTAANSAEAPPPVPQSVFVIPANAKEGRNPFFPQSKIELPNTNKSLKTESAESFPIVLNGITSPPKRMAMINGRTFESGESGELKLQNGSKISIECLEIRSDAAVIRVGTQRRELRLRNGL